MRPEDERFAVQLKALRTMDSSRHFNFVGQDWHGRLSHESVLGNLLCIIGVSKAAKYDAALVDENPQASYPTAQTRLEAVFEIIQAFRFRTLHGRGIRWLGHFNSLDWLSRSLCETTACG